MRAEKSAKEPFKRIFTYPLLRHTEMSDDMKSEAMKLVTNACEAFPSNNQSVAQMIKESMDKKYGGSWHTVVGEQFGLDISHEQGSLLYMFFGGNVAICLWKCT